MLSTYEIVLYAAVIPLLPLVVWSLMTGSIVPENTIFSKYYRAEKYLGLTGNLLLLAVCAQSAARLAQHYGVFNPAISDQLIFWVGVPFLALLFVSSAMWIRAILRVRSDRKRSAFRESHVHDTD